MNLDNTELQDRKQIKELMRKEHDASYLEQFAFSRLALLDIIDNDIINNKDKDRLAEIAEKLTETDLEPLQAKIDTAIYELTFMDPYKATATQQAFVETRKGNLDLNKLVSRKADNRLLTTHLLVNKGMPVSRDLKRNLHANGHDELVSLIDKLQAKSNREQNSENNTHQEQKSVKAKNLNMKM